MHRVVLLLVGLLALTGITVASTGGATQAQPRWVITDLGTFGGWDSEALAVNERGVVVGLADTTTKDASGLPVAHPFIWQNGELRRLPTPRRYRGCRPSDLNEQGAIAGTCENGPFASRAVLWRGGRMLDLGVRKRSDYTFVQSGGDLVNERGQVLGWSGEDYDGEHYSPFVWTRGRLIDLGGLEDDGIDSEADAINDHGEVVGGAWRLADYWHAFLWQAGKMRDLGVGKTSSEAVAINEHGQIAGWSGRSAARWQNDALLELRALPGAGYAKAVAINEKGTAVGWSAPSVDSYGHARSPRATLWRSAEGIDLGTLSKTRFSQAVAINDRGQVVGWSATRLKNGDPSDPRAFIWQDGKLSRLPTLGGQLSQAMAITNNGQIIGWAETKRGLQHAVLWTLKR